MSRISGRPLQLARHLLSLRIGFQKPQQSGRQLDLKRRLVSRVNFVVIFTHTWSTIFIQLLLDMACGRINRFENIPGIELRDSISLVPPLKDIHIAEYIITDRIVLELKDKLFFVHRILFWQLASPHLLIQVL